MIPKNVERRVRQHVYAKQNDFFAIIQPGFESIALSEITRLCPELSDAEITEGGIGFNAKVKDVWKLNYSSGTLTRIIMRIAHFKAFFFNELRKEIEDIPWELYLNPGEMPDFSIKCRHSKLYHTGRIEEECLKGILSCMNKIYPDYELSENVESKQTIFIRMENDICTVSLDTTGEPLYRRDMRSHVAEAPIRETLAACILREARAERFNTILDPMCGSSVIPMEAALIRHGIPPGSRRNFAFENWPGHSEKAFEYMKKTVQQEMKSNLTAFGIYASDSNQRAVDAAIYNISNSGFSDYIDLKQKDFFSLDRSDYPEGKMLIVFNPPYGGRLDLKNIGGFFHKIGEKLRADFTGCSFAIIVPVGEAEKALNLPTIKRIPFRNGGLKVALVIGNI